MGKEERKEEKEAREGKREEEEEEEAEDWDEVSSQASSASSCDSYIIVLPDCFDTSRPLGESMYSSALSLSGLAAATTEGEEPEPEELDRATPEGEGQEGSEVAAPAPAVDDSVNQMLCASQTLAGAPLTPEVAPPPVSLLPPAVSYSPRPVLHDGLHDTNVIATRPGSVSCSS